MGELKPCPFCGGKVRIVKGYGNIHMIDCPKCGAYVSFRGKEAVGRCFDAWNKRTVFPSIEDRSNELEIDDGMDN